MRNNCLKLRVIILVISVLYFNISFEVIATTKCQQDYPILDTLNGKIRGKCDSVTISMEDGLNKINYYYSWESVPYAKPPIHQLRFKPPQSFDKPWIDTLDGTKPPNACMQYINKNLVEKFEFTNFLGINKHTKMSEDCLYLNIYVPADVYNLKLNGNDQLAPIVVYFHGGDGEMGSGSNEIYNPSIVSTMTGIIYITINYRLGIFGFLYLKDRKVNDMFQESYEGNQAILDQYLALKWISENAVKFNGDSSRITLIGHEAGSRFVGYHLIHQPSWQYFRNVIMLSGSPVHLNKNFISSETAYSRAKLFLKHYYNCELSNRLVDCLHNIDSGNLTITTRTFLNQIMSNGSQLTAINIKSPFVPVIDGKIFKDSPIRSFRLGNYKKCNIIFGFGAQDGSSLIPLNFGFNQTKKDSQTNLNHQIINFGQLAEFIKKFYNYYPFWPNKNSEIIINSILNEYTRSTLRSIHNQKSYKQNYFHTLSKILTDEAYACPIFKLADYIANQITPKVYLFIYNHRIFTSKWPKNYGVVNGDILPMIFGQPFNKNLTNNKQTDFSYNPWKSIMNSSNLINEKKISKEIIIRLANFVNDDNPNTRLNNLEQNKFWPEFKPLDDYNNSNEDNTLNTTRLNESLYLSIKHNGTTVKRLSHHHDSCHLWNNLIPSHLDVLAEMRTNANSSFFHTNKRL